jgi:hypothetical protein
MLSEASVMLSEASVMLSEASVMLSEASVIPSDAKNPPRLQRHRSAQHALGAGTSSDAPPQPRP